MPALQGGSFKGYAEAAWLAKRFAFTVLPSLSSLRALRRFAREAKSTVTFAGFGDPLLDGHPNTKRSAPLASLFDARGGADVEAVRKLPALPDTASELLRIARSLGQYLGSERLRLNRSERHLPRTGGRRRAVLNGNRGVTTLYQCSLLPEAPRLSSIPRSTSLNAPR